MYWDGGWVGGCKGLQMNLIELKTMCFGLLVLAHTVLQQQTRFTPFTFYHHQLAGKHRKKTRPLVVRRCETAVTSSKKMTS